MFNKEALEEIRDGLLRNGEMMAVAESLSAAFSTVSHAATFFQGSITGHSTKPPESGNELHAYYAVVHKDEVPEESIIASFCKRSNSRLTKVYESGKAKIRGGSNKAVASSRTH